MNYYAAVRAFLLVSEVGSFDLAAQRLSIEASTVSRYIANLESDLGIVLFYRSARGVELTDSGAMFRERVNVAFRGVGEARRAVSDRAR
ncbi:LysR family transcriptional regulator [Paraburkholderia sp. BR10936]|uniref:LysR family transcriptional regulator n=1 Tax=Paraburkholderia sp. BR10936 TaxID=3236993 RepID=UPI0034D18217